ncbi:hypothetical protein BD410DRAFT_896084 [Rickenella mellea]|uniref:CsbD-like domain-containing protein n=1 Tax=Rickenella mellea TaxID=50990 RepID=A0A4Y7QCH4_9AGAM|nr:hypothetical protein BD410DRAFT_896084 [Rickenella mellea]
MPLFKHNHDNIATDPSLPPAGANTGYGTTGQNTGVGPAGTGMGTGHHHGLGHNTNTTGTGMTGQNAGMGTGAGGGPLTGGAAGAGGAGVGTAAGTGSAMHQNPMYQSPNVPMADGAAMPAGTHAGVTTGTDKHGNPIQPTHNTHSGGSGGKALTGKIEHAVGTMIGSESLKAKGLAKEQEANALKAQSAELSQAERLEAEALARRERAVAHGAHPDHKHLGGHNPGAGAMNPNEISGGAEYGISGAGGAGSNMRGGY